MKVTKLYWVMNIMQIIQGVEAELHTFLTLAPDGSGLQSHSAHACLETEKSCG
jgi:hypothetical protein